MKQWRTRHLSLRLWRLIWPSYRSTPRLTWVSAATPSVLLQKESCQVGFLIWMLLNSSHAPHISWRENKQGFPFPSGPLMYTVCWRNTPEKLTVISDQFGCGRATPEPLNNLLVTLHDLHPLHASVSLTKEAVASCMAIFVICSIGTVFAHILKNNKHLAKGKIQNKCERFLWTVELHKFRT